ncbi:hypothetical protein D3C85_1746750 [compost metagenome]
MLIAYNGYNRRRQLPGYRAKPRANLFWRMSHSNVVGMQALSDIYQRSKPSFALPCVPAKSTVTFCNCMPGRVSSQVLMQNKSGRK